MAIDERHRHELHEAARRAFGDQAAVTLMEMLPPVGWADVATKRDLDHIVEVCRLQLERSQADLRTEMAELRTDVTSAIADLSRRLTFRFLAIAVAIFGTGVVVGLS